jgi:hypothetical protein
VGLVGDLGFEPSEYLTCRFYRPVPLRRRSRSPMKLSCRLISTGSCLPHFLPDRVSLAFGCEPPHHSPSALKASVGATGLDLLTGLEPARLGLEVPAPILRQEDDGGLGWTRTSLPRFGGTEPFQSARPKEVHPGPKPLGRLFTRPAARLSSVVQIEAGATHLPPALNPDRVCQITTPAWEPALRSTSFSAFLGS